jgi:PKD repeat protein
MSNKFTPFEDKIRGSLEHYELPFEASSWNDLENRMKGNGTSANTWVVALVAACFFSAIGSFILYKYSFNLIDAKKGHGIARFESKSRVSNSSSSIENGSIDSNVTANNPSTNRSNPLNLTPLAANVSSSSNSTDSSIPTESILTDIDTQQNEVVAPKTSTTLSVRPSVTTSCAGGEIDFNAVNGPNEGSYLWNFGDGNFSNKPNPKHKYVKPGVYDVSLSITSKKDGQINTTVMNDLITIHPAPNAEFEWDFVNSASEEPTVKIINTSENATSYNWKFGDGSTSKVISPIRSYTDRGKQMIALEVSNEWGCSDSKVKYIHINQDYNLMAPEKFSPKTNVFMPDGLKQGKSQFKLTIYNGEKPIYETTNKSKGWDGTLPSGTTAVAGDQYPWIVIIYNDTTKEEKYFSGIVTILP